MAKVVCSTERHLVPQLAAAERALQCQLEAAEFAGKDGEVSGYRCEPLIVVVQLAQQLVIQFDRVEAGADVGAPCELPLRLTEGAGSLAMVAVTDQELVVPDE